MRRFFPFAGTIIAAVILAGCMSPDENAAFAALNDDRAAYSVPALVANEPLVSRAQNWAKKLLAESGDVCSIKTLVHSNLLDNPPAGAKVLGENVGCIRLRGSVRDSVAQLETAFMGSPDHKENILNPSFDSGGIGVASKELPDGTILVFEAQEFAGF